MDVIAMRVSREELDAMPTIDVRGIDTLHLGRPAVFTALEKLIASWEEPAELEKHYTDFQAGVKMGIDYAVTDILVDLKALLAEYDVW